MCSPKEPSIRSIPSVSRFLLCYKPPSMTRCAKSPWYAPAKSNKSNPHVFVHMFTSYRPPSMTHVHDMFQQHPIPTSVSPWVSILNHDHPMTWVMIWGCAHRFPETFMFHDIFQPNPTPRVWLKYMMATTKSPSAMPSLAMAKARTHHCTTDLGMDVVDVGCGINACIYIIHIQIYT